MTDQDQPVALPAQTFVTERHTIPAQGELEIGYDFQPDQIYIVSPSLNLELGINCRLVGAQGGGAIPILGQGPVIIPGVTAAQRLKFESFELEDVELAIIAQRGYAPVSLTMPTSIAAGTTIGIESIDSYAGNPNTDGYVSGEVATIPSLTYAGAYALVAIGARDTYYTNNNDAIPSAVTFGGNTLSSLIEQDGGRCHTDHPSGGVSLWGAEVATQGDLNLAITFPDASDMRAVAVAVIGLARSVNPGVTDSETGNGNRSLTTTGLAESAIHFHAYEDFETSGLTQSGGPTTIVSKADYGVDSKADFILCYSTGEGAVQSTCSGHGGHGYDQNAVGVALELA